MKKEPFVVSAIEPGLDFLYTSVPIAIPSYDIETAPVRVVCMLPANSIDPQNIKLAYRCDPVTTNKVPAQTIVITMSTAWLNNTFGSADPNLSAAIYMMTLSAKPVLLQKQSSHALNLLLEDIYDHAGYIHPDHFCLKAKTLAVLYQIFRRLLIGTSTENSLRATLLHDTMPKAKKILEQYLNTTLPSVATIARELAMSESSFKRNFREYYKMSVYEYYLQLKMERALMLLEDRAIPIKEIAYLVGYDKPGNFIRVFKKYFHDSPGNMQRRIVEDK